MSDAARPVLLYVVSEDWYFLSHRPPMARAAKAAGFAVHVATNLGAGEDAIVREGFVPHAVSFSRGQLSPSASLATILALRRLYRDLKPAVIHHVALQPVVLGSLAASGLDAAQVNALTGLGYAFTSTSAKARVVGALLRAVMRITLVRPRAITLVQNRDDAAMVRSLGVPAANVALIPGSGIDLAQFAAMPEPPAPVTAAFVGRLLDDKGVRTFVAAHALLRARGVPLALLIAGTPDPANPASVPQAEAESWNTLPDVKWLGHISDVAALWAKAHIAVLPSRREGLPKSLLEAAACGRPLVATDVPGCRDVAIAGETGLLVPVDDAPALADALARLANDGALRARYGANARRLAEERFASDKIGHAVVELYRRLMDTQGEAG